jgi:hypothetical protein
MKTNWLIIIVILTIIIGGCSAGSSANSQSVESISTVGFVPTKTSSNANFATPTRKIQPTDEGNNINLIESTPTKGSTPSNPAEPSSTSSASLSATSTPRPEPTLKPDEWKELPVIPEISETVVDIYQRGLDSGNNPNAFSKVGDCGTTPAWFLGDFDRGPKYYDLGEYQHLEEVIEVYEGSFGRTSLAARSGYNASSLFVPLWADRDFCEADEAPLVCEYRNHSPIIAFIMLGANDVWHPDEFDPQMRKIIEYSIDNGVIPILSTKADNQEGDGSINAAIARLAMEYDIPLLNFWLAVQPLPGNGLVEDGVHLSFGRNFFDDPDAMSQAWPVRNLTALQTLDEVWRKVTGQSQ